MIKKLIGAFFIFGAAGMALKYSYQTLSTGNIVIGSRGLIEFLILAIPAILFTISIMRNK